MPPNGTNTNSEDSRYVPILPNNDSPDISYIIRESIHAGTGATQYLTMWAPSYNMTRAAIDARLEKRLGGSSPFTILGVPRISLYDSRNFDVEWQPSLEPKSTFLLPDGGYLDIFTEHENRSSRDRKRARVEARYAKPLPPCTAFSARADTTYPNKEQSSHEYYNNILSANPTAPAYAFLSIELPHGKEPKNRKDAFRSVDRKHWVFAMDTEYQQLLDALTWTPVLKSEAQNIISGKWIFKIKRNADGTIERYKARWVARGFSQIKDIDYTEIFAPVIRYSSVRLLCAMANAYNINLYGLDVSNAFARSDVDEELIVEPPHGYETYAPNGEPYMCRLNKGLYGTKQAARLWHQKMRNTLFATGWKQLESDPCIFTRTTAEFGTELIGLYVDDIIHAARNDEAHADFLATCNTQFPTTSQGELKYILKMEITRDRENRKLWLTQTRAITDFLEEQGLASEFRSASTPMDSDWKYGEKPDYIDPSKHKSFRSRVGSISYFAQCTRADIAYAINCLCRHLDSPNDNCFRALDRLERYLATHPDLGILFSMPSGKKISLETCMQEGFSPPETQISAAFSDASYGGEDHNSGKSQTGYAIYFAGGLIDWSSHLQSVIAHSSAESEQIAAFQTARNVIYWRQLLHELSLAMSASTIIFEDNQACIAQSKNSVNHKRSKHILLKYHYLRHLTESGEICLEYIETANQIADIFTKPLNKQLFTNLVTHIAHAKPTTSSTTSTT